MRDVSIMTALVTPEGDDGIEILFNMRPSIHGNNEWDWRVSSVDITGVKKDHMSGSISINTRPRGKASRQIPHFTQRASGKAWNQALREVGFDYGSSFQDMDDVRFDGKQFHASCTTNIRQVVDEHMGESRYVLHPASVDSTLQLCIGKTIRPFPIFFQSVLRADLCSKPRLCDCFLFRFLKILCALPLYLYKNYTY